MFTVRLFQPEDEPPILEIYRQAFQGEPWKENLPAGTVLKRWRSYQDKLGFDCLVATDGEIIVGATWWDTPTLEELGIERGWELEVFARRMMLDNSLVWEREVIVDPIFQNQGIATILRRAFLSSIEPAFVLTRMRTDNFPILRVASKLGFEPTGIQVPSHKWPKVVHEYWWKLVQPEPNH